MLHGLKNDAHTLFNQTISSQSCEILCEYGIITPIYYIRRPDLSETKWLTQAHKVTKLWMAIGLESSESKTVLTALSKK